MFIVSYPVVTTKDRQVPTATNINNFVYFFLLYLLLFSSSSIKIDVRFFLFVGVGTACS